MPVPESETVMVRSSAEVKHDSQNLITDVSKTDRTQASETTNDETRDSDDFD